jgi:hypothetical protein
MERLTAVLQVSIMPSAFWMRKTGAAGDVEAGTAAGAMRTVSPALPTTISLKMALLPGVKLYFIAATAMEININAAHILLNAM